MRYFSHVLLHFIRYSAVLTCRGILRVITAPKNGSEAGSGSGICAQGAVVVYRIRLQTAERPGLIFNFQTTGSPWAISEFSLRHGRSSQGVISA
jgi:hypothetical protein